MEFLSCRHSQYIVSDDHLFRSLMTSFWVISKRFPFGVDSSVAWIVLLGRSWCSWVSFANIWNPWVFGFFIFELDEIAVFFGFEKSSIINNLSFKERNIILDLNEIAFFLMWEKSIVFKGLPIIPRFWLSNWMSDKVNSWSSSNKQ